MSDFSDRPFVAGSLIGLRAFAVDEMGRLSGPSFGGIFQPGENQARCGGDSPLAAMSIALTNLSSFRFTYAPPSTAEIAVEDIPLTETSVKPKTLKRPDPPPHVVGGIHCGCGYYAYFNGDNTYAQPNRVSALIEGYGVCTVGEKGFRASKARLVALVLPARPHPSLRHPALYDRYADLLYRKSFGPFAGVACLIAGAFAAVFGIGETFTDSPLYAPLALLGLALIFLCGVTMKADFHGIDRAYPSLHNLATCAIPSRKSSRGMDYAAIRRNYPDVPVYGSVKAALAAHPLTPPEPDPLPTPDDEDFWTREVPR